MPPPADSLPAESVPPAAAPGPDAAASQPGVDERLAAAEADGAPAARTAMAEELGLAVGLLRDARTSVEHIFLSARRQRVLELGRAMAVVEEIAASVERNPGALISLARLKEPGDYTALHAVAVSALMMALGRQLGLERGELLEVGLGGLLHDIGKAWVPQEVLERPGPLREAEFALMRRHPVQGYAMLAESGKVGPIPLEICLRHHERLDGSGYPQALAGEALGTYARMAAICDVYDAITSERPYQDSGQSALAIRSLAAEAGKTLDERIFHAFVKAVGIYPVGAMVRLASQRLAVVVEQGEASLLAPRVRVFFSTADKRRIPAEIVDLADPAANDRIVATEDAERWRFGRLESLWLGQPALAA